MDLDKFREGGIEYERKLWFRAGYLTATENKLGGAKLNSVGILIYLDQADEEYKELAKKEAERKLEGGGNHECH